MEFHGKLEAHLPSQSKRMCIARERSCQNTRDQRAFLQGLESADEGWAKIVFTVCECDYIFRSRFIMTLPDNDASVARFCESQSLISTFINQKSFPQHQHSASTANKAFADGDTQKPAASAGQRLAAHISRLDLVIKG